jgi:hypothetical protein
MCENTHHASRITHHASRTTMTTPFLELNDPEISAEALTTALDERVRQRRAKLGPVERAVPAFGTAVPCPQQPANLDHPPTLYHHLRQANDLYGRPATALVLAASPATRVPLLGRLWAMIREQAHSLVLFYVNRSLAHQTTINRHTISAVNQLTLLSQEQQRTIHRLEQEIGRLRQELQKEREKDI